MNINQLEMLKYNNFARNTKDCSRDQNQQKNKGDGSYKKYSLHKIKICKLN